MAVRERNVTIKQICMLIKANLLKRIRKKSSAPESLQEMFFILDIYKQVLSDPQRSRAAFVPMKNGRVTLCIPRAAFQEWNQVPE